MNMKYAIGMVMLLALLAAGIYLYWGTTGALISVHEDDCSFSNGVVTCTFMSNKRCGEWSGGVVLNIRAYKGTAAICEELGGTCVYGDCRYCDPPYPNAQIKVFFTQPNPSEHDITLTHTTYDNYIVPLPFSSDLACSYDEINRDGDPTPIYRTVAGYVEISVPSGGGEPEPPECTLASDCEGKPHIDCTGHWMCENNSCSWICDDEPPEPPPPDIGTSTVFLIIAVVMVIVFVVLAIWIVRRKT